jgi:hypothetical protein
MMFCTRELKLHAYRLHLVWKVTQTDWDSRKCFIALDMTRPTTTFCMNMEQSAVMFVMIGEAKVMVKFLL